MKKLAKLASFFQILEPFLENIARNSLRFALRATIRLMFLLVHFEHFRNELRYQVKILATTEAENSKILSAPLNGMTHPRDT